LWFTFTLGNTCDLKYINNTKKTLKNLTNGKIKNLKTSRKITKKSRFSSPDCIGKDYVRLEWEKS